MPARNEIEVIINAQDNASGVLDGMLDRISGIGTNLMKVGAGITAATAPIAIALGAAVNSAVQFDTSMTNVGAVLGKSRADMAGLNKEVLRIGANSRAGPQAAAEAFYDIVGGVADANSHMAILEASIRTAEAGSADLGSTTSTLISVMNSYGFAASDASFASDVLTRTVGMGVGSMEDFAGAMPKLTGLTSSVGITFDQAAASVAYMTTKGFTASESVTRLNSAINSILTPNKAMKEAMDAAGMASGSQALEMYGLAGTLGRVQVALGGSTDAMALAMGSSEAMAAANALNEASFESFISTFEDGVAGATTAAQALQLDSPAAQMELFKSKIGALGITVGTLLIPPLMDLADKITPVIDGVLQWAQQNPDLMTGVVAVALAAVAAGPVIGMLGMAITAVTTAVGILLSPVVLLAVGIAGIVAAAQLGYPGGIVGLFNDATRTAQQLAFLGLYVLNLTAEAARQGLSNLATGLSEAFTRAGEFARGIMGLTLAGGAFVLLLTQSTIGVSAWTAVTTIAQTVSAGASALWGLMSGAMGLLTGAFGGATLGVGAFATTMAAAVAPIIAIGLAIAGVIAQINQFNSVSEEGRKGAQATAAAGLASGKISQQDVYDQSFKSAQAEHGDLFARVFYSNIAGSVLAGARAGGGPLVGGENYLVGEEGPEIIKAPQGGGTVIPNHQLGGGGMTISGPITVNANSEAEGRAGARGFVAELDALMRKGG